MPVVPSDHGFVNAYTRSPLASSAEARQLAQLQAQHAEVAEASTSGRTLRTSCTSGSLHNSIMAAARYHQYAGGLATLRYQAL
jgi:hypothetical protein